MTTSQEKPKRILIPESGEHGASIRSAFHSLMVLHIFKIKCVSQASATFANNNESGVFHFSSSPTPDSTQLKPPFTTLEEPLPTSCNFYAQGGLEEVQPGFQEGSMVSNKTTKGQLPPEQKGGGLTSLGIAKDNQPKDNQHWLVLKKLEL